MLTNDIKKGMRVKLSSGWFGTMYDNKKGNTRVVDVEGDFHEIGSVYAWDIVAVNVDNVWHGIELTPKQLKAKTDIEKMF